MQDYCNSEAACLAWFENDNIISSSRELNLTYKSYKLQLSIIHRVKVYL